MLYFNTKLLNANIGVIFKNNTEDLRSGRLPPRRWRTRIKGSRYIRWEKYIIPPRKNLIWSFLRLQIPAGILNLMMKTKLLHFVLCFLRIFFFLVLLFFFVFPFGYTQPMRKRIHYFMKFITLSSQFFCLSV